jgi:cytochrome P450
MHDPAVYPTPFKFYPERFLSRSEDPKLNPDPRRYAFGFGRRSCPGQFLAEDVLFIAIVTTLAVFYIAPADKTVKDVDFEYTSAVVRYEWICFIQHCDVPAQANFIATRKH